MAENIVLVFKTGKIKLSSESVLAYNYQTSSKFTPLFPEKKDIC